jgi:hypothetical protein
MIHIIFAPRELRPQGLAIPEATLKSGTILAMVVPLTSQAVSALTVFLKFQLVLYKKRHGRQIIWVINSFYSNKCKP